MVFSHYRRREDCCNTSAAGPHPGDYSFDLHCLSHSEGKLHEGTADGFTRSICHIVFAGSSLQSLPVCMNGLPLSVESPENQALIAFYRWISRDMCTVSQDPILSNQRRFLCHSVHFPPESFVSGCRQGLKRVRGKIVEHSCHYPCYTKRKRSPCYIMNFYFP